jgi:DNA primase
MDVISLHMSGIENVVASSGTSLTTEQIKLIKRLTENVTILFDGDNAGIKASFRSIDMLLTEGMNIRDAVSGWMIRFFRQKTSAGICRNSSKMKRWIY